MKFPFLNEGSDRKLVREADGARDAGAWGKAAALYSEFLETNPSDFDIIVQLGNCFKEAGELDKSIIAYQKAIMLNPSDSDVHLQRGHALKLADRKQDSISAYKEAYKLNSKNQHALRELIQLNEVSHLPIDSKLVDLKTKTIWLDITDLIEYSKHNQSLSGIQRVVANLASYVRNVLIEGYRVIPIIPEYDRSRILATNPALVAALIALFDTPGADRQLIDKSIKAIYASRYLVTPSGQDIMMVAGAFWIYPNYDVISRLRQTGMRFGVFIHDLIQIKNPEYVHHDAVEVFQKKLVDILSVSDFVLANSEFVASEIRQYMLDKLNFSVPVKAIPLATELRGVGDQNGLVNQHIIDVCSEEFVLCVCTIEVRKNHLYLIRIWEKLRAKHGDKVPKLVFVGKWGWDIEQLQQHLEKLGCVDDWLFIFNGISDDELEYIYRRCLFTAYTSFAEGFGLPIGESLVHGKPCIASNTTSMPEVGGRFARYVDPFNVEDGYRAFEQALVDRKDLESWAVDIQTNFKPKSWNTFCNEFYTEITEYHRSFESKDSQLNCVLPAGTVIESGDRAVMKLANSKRKIVTLNSGRRSGWSHVESWGVWSVSRRATLEFVANEPPNTEIQAFLRVRCPPDSESTQLVLRCGKHETDVDLGSKDKFVPFAGSVDDRGHVRIELIAQGRYGATGERQCYVGLTALAYCRHDDPLQRIGMLEKVTLY
jgi:glycosyltransferase involved in cell wall biosynthesis